MRKSIAAVALASLLGAVAMLIASPVGAMASGNAKPHDPLNAPTFQQQSKNWTAAQFQRYQDKLLRARSFGGRSGVAPQYCCIPNSFYATMTVVYEGSADCMCGPATATEMFSTLTAYWNNPPYPYLTLAQVESQMNISCSVGTYRTQLLNEMNGHQTFNNYVWQDVASASDVHYYTGYDLGVWQTPVGYNGETYSWYHGHPLDNYATVDWRHYFPADGYQPGQLEVGDPHFDYNHWYTDEAVYEFIDNLPYTNQVLW
jgi:hypothetical protein